MSPRWVDLHWPCAAAMLEAGVMDERGEWVEDKDVRLGLEAYRERLGDRMDSGLAGGLRPPDCSAGARL